MIEFLLKHLKEGGLTNCCILQRGGGSYNHADIKHVDSVGIIAWVKDEVKAIPWTSINEIGPSA